MEVLYLDRLFAVNLLIDYCVLLAAARVCGVVLRRGRYALAALVGAAYASVLVLPGCGWLGSGWMKLALGVLLSLIAFGGEPELWRCTAVFFAVAALFGGAVYAATLLAGGDPLRGTLMPLPWRVFALAFGVSYAAVSLVFRRRMRRAAREIRPVTVTVGGRTACLQGLRDSGNDLHDPVTLLPAAVADRAALTEQLGLPALPDDPAEAITVLCGRGIKARLLPYRGLGAAGLLPAFRPDRAEVDGREEALLIALSPAPLREPGCQILLPPASEETLSAALSRR